jgi:aminoglycoside 6'-N-acetyltransferase I
MRIVRAAPADLDRIDPLRRSLWPDAPIEELKARADDLTGPTPSYAVLIAQSEAGEAIGFAEVALRRDYVEGCDTSPAAFLEGIYTDPSHRQQGIARALVQEARLWGQERGVSDLGSNALLDNVESHAFHRAIGFSEMERVVYFHMPIMERAS